MYGRTVDILDLLFSTVSLLPQCDTIQVQLISLYKATEFPSHADDLHCVALHHKAREKSPPNITRASQPSSALTARKQPSEGLAHISALPLC